MSIAELYDKNVIENLPSDAWFGEILARNLQDMSSDAVTIAQYIQVVGLEAKKHEYKQIS